MAQQDYFRFHAKKGERVIFDVNAYRSGSPLDSSLAVLDAAGKELARNEDANGLDSFIDFAVPDEGDYVLQLRDFRYQGGPNFKYHLTAGAVPYVDTIFPLGGQRGQPVEITLNGRNLDETKKLKLKIDSGAPLGFQEVRAHTPRGYSNARLFEVSEFSEFMEQEPNNETTNANMVAVPININGHLGQEKDVDVFKFKVSKGQRLIFEVAAGRYGSAADALLTITGTNGTVIARNDDAVGADARIDQTFAEAGEYYVSIRDLNERGGENFPYRLSIRPPAEGNFSAKVLADALRVNRGSRTTVRVDVTRTGFGGPVEIVAEDWPKGVTCEPLLVAPEISSGILEIAAAPDAALGSVPFELIAVGVMNGKKVVRPVQPVAGAVAAAPVRRGARNPGAPGKAVKSGFLTVLEPAPFTVDWVSLAGQLEQNQSTTLQAEVQRRVDFNGDIKLSLEGFSAGADPITKSIDVQPVTLKAKDSSATFNLKAKLESELGTRPIYVKAEATVEGQLIA